MAAEIPHDPLAAGEDEEFARLKAQSRRFTMAMGLVIALAIVVAAWYVAGRQGIGELGRGGVNISLLPKVGQPAPDFATVLLDGRVVRLSDFRGRPVWLNFWGSWCPPCRAEMPEMQAAYEELGPKGLVVLAVALDEPPANSARYAALNDVTFLIASDPRRQTTGAAYPIANFPTHILIDREGIVREVVLSELDKDEIREHAGKIL